MSLGHKKRNNSNHKVTAGEVIFDRGVYTGIGFLANEALSMVMAVELRYMRGKPHFEKASRWWMKTAGFKDKAIKGVTTSAMTRAEDSLEIFTLLGGGTLLVVPMKILEDHKQTIVKNLNHLIDALPGHHVSEDAAKARDAEVEKEIACEAKQTWTSMLLGRAIATVNNMFLIKETVFAGNRTQKSKDLSLDYSNRALDQLKKVASPAMSNRLEKIRHTERFRRYGEIVGLETAYTVISSLVMEMASKFIARKSPAVKDPELCAEAQKQAKPEEAPSVIAAASFADKVQPKQKEDCKPCISHISRLTAEAAQQPAQPSL